MEYRTLSRCGIDGCKETRYYLEAGQWFCRNGHLREGELDIEAENEDFGTTTRGTRAARLETVVKKAPKQLRGRKGFELYIQCYQLILQKQVWFLIHEKGFPKELETLVRDLWAMQLHILTGHMERIRTPNASQASSVVSGYESAGSYAHTTSGEESVGTGGSRKRRKRQRVPKAEERPKLVHGPVLCYLAALTLRVPVCLGDLHRWIERQEMVYLRAIREVPEEMRKRLSAEYWIALDPRSRLKKGKLYATVQDTVRLFHERFGVIFPPVNGEMLLGRFVNELGLPLEVYMATKALAEDLCQNFAWPHMSRFMRAAMWPELRLMALAIIATKLGFGLDNLQRTPRTSDEPAATPLSWTVWEKFLKDGDMDRCGQLEIDVTEADVFQMDDEDMDRYMDWYEKTWCAQDDTENRTKLTAGILNLFPTSRPTTSSQLFEPSQQLPPPLSDSQQSTAPTLHPLQSRLSDLHSTVHHLPHDPAPTPPRKPRRRPRDPPSEDDEARPVRPGDKYLFQSTEETLPHKLKTLLQAAADLLGVERKDLQLAIRNIETMMREGVKSGKREERRREKEKAYREWRESEVARVRSEAELEREETEERGWRGMGEEKERNRGIESPRHSSVPRVIEQEAERMTGLEEGMARVVAAGSGESFMEE